LPFLAFSAIVHVGKKTGCRTQGLPLMRALAVVPARGGSKGVPRKNARHLAGKPLLWYTARAAHAAEVFDRVILSTDDVELAEIGRGCGLEVPFMRPADLAGDSAPMIGVLLHAVETMAAQGANFDAICLLQPTSPLRRPRDLRACMELLQSSAADAVVSQRAVPDKYNPHWVYFRDSGGWLHLATGEPDPIPRRQDLPPAYHRDGAIYLVRTTVLLERHSLYGQKTAGYVIEDLPLVNIDTPEDWAHAERQMSEWTGPDGLVKD
jgi:CMP-N-acetylneuraminic acid synthetase